MSMRAGFSRIVLLTGGMALACATAGAQTSIGELSASDASVKGAVEMSAGYTRVLSGSSITAGETAASLNLKRGGQVRICPRSALSVTSAAGGRDLMLALSTGTIEVHYSLAGSADTILTPDFRILLAGPGDFHFAIASDSAGSTCVRSLSATNASLIVNELLGDGIYQVHPGDQLLFRNGRLKNPETAPPDCGCPAPVPVLSANAKPPEPSPEPVAAPPAKEEKTETTKVNSESASRNAPSMGAAAPETVPPANSNAVQVVVDAPFVFRSAAAAVPPPPVIFRAELQPLPQMLFLAPPVLPPAISGPPPVSSPGPLSPFKTLANHVHSLFSRLFGQRNRA